MTPNEKGLVAAVGDKNREALSEIYRRYGGAVWSVAKRVCRHDDLAQTVCRAVFAELWSDPGRFDPSRGDLRSCLVAEAHTRAVTLVRSSSGGAATAPAAPAGVAAAEPAAELSPEAQRAVDQLPADQREAILRAYFGGRATIDGERGDIRRGLLNLRRTLAAEGVTT